MKILFVVSDFNTGGITSSLKNLTNELVNRGHSIDILNLPKYDQLPKGFNSKINLIDINGIAKYWDVSVESIRKTKGFGKTKLIFIGAIKKICNKLGIWNNIIFSKLKLLSNYDLSIGFRQGPVDYYVASKKVISNKCIGFWHVDPDYTGDTSSWDKCLYDMDVIAGVSNATCEGLLRHYPKLKGKIKTVYNMFDKKEIVEKGKTTDYLYDKNDFNIVTVARIDFELQKNLQRVPEICNKLRLDGYKIHWTIVGNGPKYNELQNIIDKTNLIDYITLVGEKNNPYPYINQADLFVLTSSWESYGMVVMESLILGTPVVSGDYPALVEILDDKYGIRAKNSVEGIYKSIKFLLENKDIYNEIKNNCESYNYTTDEAYNQFSLLNGDYNDKI